MNFAALWGLDPSVACMNRGSFGASPTAVLQVLSALPSRLNAAREALAAFLGADPRDPIGYPVLPIFAVSAGAQALRGQNDR